MRALALAFALVDKHLAGYGMVLLQDVWYGMICEPVFSGGF
jgi:hypothetical protein